MSQWPGVNKMFLKKCKSLLRMCKKRPRTDKSVDTWRDAQSCEILHIGWVSFQVVGNIVIQLDACSCWIEAFIYCDSFTEEVKQSLSVTIGRFGIPFTLVSDNTHNIINDKVVTWLQAQGCTKLERDVLNPRSNWLPERAVHAIKGGNEDIDRTWERERAILSRACQVVGFPVLRCSLMLPLKIVALDLLVSRWTTDVATTTEMAQVTSIGVSGRNTSLVVVSHTTPERVRKSISIFNEQICK